MQQELTTQEQEHRVKVAFADAWLRSPNDPFKAALSIVRGDNLTALKVLKQLQHDPEIHEIKAQLVEEHGEEAFLPTKEQMLRGVLNRAEQAIEDSDYCRLMTLAFDVRGMTSKGGNLTINNNTHTDNRTMSIPVMINNVGEVASDEEWEQALVKQQQGLVQYDNG